MTPRYQSDVMSSSGVKLWVGSLTIVILDGGEEGVDMI